MIAVTGASGWVGHEVCRWLESQHHVVRRFVRKPNSAAEIALDLAVDRFPSDVVAALVGCEAVVHCAAHVHRREESDEAQARFLQINTRGTARLLAACREAGVARFVLVGTSAVYDWSANRPMAENDVLAPVTAYARSKFEAEALVGGADIDGRIARLATVYGNGDRANFARLAVALRRRRFLLPGAGQTRKSVLEVKQAGEVLGRLALLPALRDRIVNVAAPCVPTLHEICDALSAACGVKPPRRAPLPLLRIAARVGDGLARIAGHAPLTSDVLRKLTTPTVLDTDRLVRLFPEIKWKSFRDSLQDSSDYYARIE